MASMIYPSKGIVGPYIRGSFMSQHFDFWIAVDGFGKDSVAFGKKSHCSEPGTLSEGFRVITFMVECEMKWNNQKLSG